MSLYVLLLAEAWRIYRIFIMSCIDLHGTPVLCTVCVQCCKNCSGPEVKSVLRCTSKQKVKFDFPKIAVWPCIIAFVMFEVELVSNMLLAKWFKPNAVRLVPEVSLLQAIPYLEKV